MDAILIGLMCGAANSLVTLLVAYLILRPKPKRPTVTAPTIAQKAASLLGWKPDPKPESKTIPTRPIPRVRLGWREQRRALEREHNSKQKERDSRLPSL